MKELSYWPRQILKIVQVVDLKKFAIESNNGNTSVTFKTKTEEITQTSKDKNKILMISASGNPKAMLNIYDLGFENIKVSPNVSDAPVSVSFDVVLGQNIPKSYSLLLILPDNFDFLQRPRYYRNCLILNQEVLDNQIIGRHFKI
jgi:hypothetical protein